MWEILRKLWENFPQLWGKVGNFPQLNWEIFFPSLYRREVGRDSCLWGHFSKRAHLLWRHVQTPPLSGITPWYGKRKSPSGTPLQSCPPSMSMRYWRRGRVTAVLVRGSTTQRRDRQQEHPPLPPLLRPPLLRPPPLRLPQQVKQTPRPRHHHQRGFRPTLKTGRSRQGCTGAWEPRLPFDCPVCIWRCRSLR